jgi:hypothetical protein
MNTENKTGLHLNTVVSNEWLINQRTFIEILIEQSSHLEMAVRYASFGMHVLPLHRPVEQGCSCGKKDCSSVGKHPKTENGHHGATTNVVKIIKWPHWEESNIGIAVEPSGFVVIDIDPGHGGDLNALPLHPEDLNTPIARTGGGGLHLIYRAPTGFMVSQSNKRLPPGIDVRSRGYIVAAPSRHVSGNHYQWLRGKSPFELRPLPLPADLMEVLVKVGEVDPPVSPPPQPIPNKRRPTQHPEPGDKKSLDDIIGEGLTRIAQSQPGNRNNTLNGVSYVMGIQCAIGWLQRHEAERMLKDAALARGLGETETLKTINSGLNAGIQAHQQKT